MRTAQYREQPPLRMAQYGVNCSWPKLLILTSFALSCSCAPPCSQFKGIPMEVEVDMSIPEEGRMSKAGQVLVDLATKRVY